MKPDYNKRVEFNCELNFQCYLCLEVGLLIRRYVSYWGNFSFADGDHVLAAKQHVQKTGLFVWNYLVLLVEEAWPVVAGQAKKLSDITEQQKIRVTVV